MDSMERKLNKHLKKCNVKSFTAPHDRGNRLDEDIYTPIEEVPPYDSIEPNVKIGDIVVWSFDAPPSKMFRFTYPGDRNYEKDVGLVIGARWVKAEKSTRFSKKLGEWVSKFMCFPQAIVMWSDGNVLYIPMRFLIRKDA